MALIRTMAVTSKNCFDGDVKTTYEAIMHDSESNLRWPKILGESLALDFANTVRGRGTDQLHETLNFFRDLADWALAARLINDTDHQRHLLSHTSEDAVITSIIELREAIYSIAASISSSQVPSENDLAILEKFSASSMAKSGLQVGKKFRLKWQLPAISENIYNLECHVTWSALQTFMSEDPKRIRRCPGEACGVIFIDRSKNGSRIWCDMSTCGNRAKARNRRQRLRCENV
jgi:predicted RNA-binding Zn ribbon-like protein